MRGIGMSLVLLVASIVAATALTGWGLTARTGRVSVSTAGVEGDHGSYEPSISADARFVAFTSIASNLVAGDTNTFSDVFVRDRWTHTTRRVSVSSGGVEGNSDSAEPSISANGRFVAFTSDASNLVTGDTNDLPDVFVRDIWTHSTKRVSVSSAGVQGDSYSAAPSISSDGRFVAFTSVASNLVGGDANAVYDVFVRDRWTRTTTRVSVSSGGVEGNSDSYDPSISADGRFVAYYSWASNLIGVDANGTTDVFVRDRRVHTTDRVSVSSAGGEGNSGSDGPSISGNGRFVAFRSLAANLVGGDTNGASDVFVRDRWTGTTRRVSTSSAGIQGNADSAEASISADGHRVAFYSVASNLVPSDTNGAFDVFVRDRWTGRTARVSVSSTGVQGNADSYQPSICASEPCVAFRSLASNLVTGDTNDVDDVFVHGA